MSMQNSSQDKTEQATPKRLADARKKGQIAKSSDITSAMSFLGLLLVFSFTAPTMVEIARAFVAESIGNIHRIQSFDSFQGSLWVNALGRFASLIWPLLTTGVLVGVAANIAQVGFAASLEPLKPDLSRINPAEGLKRMFSSRAMFDLAKALLKLTLIAFAAYSGIRGQIDRLLLLGYVEGYQVFVITGEVIYAVALRVALTYLFIGVIDLVHEKFKFRKQMRMSKQEVKEEHKQMEGDPQLKARLREKQRAIATQRMFDAIPGATVLVTNPTHFAIALKYEAGQEMAPQVVAKAQDYLALRMIEKAREHKVPVVRQVELARALYKQVEVGNEIPVLLYRTVAEVLAEVFAEKNERKGTI